MSAVDHFPLRGVIGVVANSTEEIQLAADRALQCIELRADLLLDTGLPESQLFDAIKLAKSKSIAVLFTLRHPTHGGKFAGGEHERVVLSRKALDAGADLIDFEWGTEAAASANELAGSMILSHHDFNAMPDDQQLHELTVVMQNTGARAIKVVPTAATVEDAVTMLRWVGKSAGNVRRIGFAMGETGACSRILTTAFGGPVTYASFGEPVAPGQIAIDALLEQYKVARLNNASKLIAVCGDAPARNARVDVINAQSNTEQRNWVAIGFTTHEKPELVRFKSDLRIAEIESV